MTKKYSKLRDLISTIVNDLVNPQRILTVGSTSREKVFSYVRLGTHRRRLFEKDYAH